MTKIATITIHASAEEVLLELQSEAPGLAPTDTADGLLKITKPIVYTGTDRAWLAALEALRALVDRWTQAKNERHYVGDPYPLQIEVRRKGRAPEAVRYGKIADSDGHEVLFPNGRRILLTTPEWIAIGLVSLCDAQFSEETVRLYREQLILGFAGPFLQAADELRARLNVIATAPAAPPTPPSIVVPAPPDPAGEDAFSNAQLDLARRTAWAWIAGPSDGHQRAVLATVLRPLPPEERRYLRWLAYDEPTEDDLEALRRRVDAHLHAAWSRTTGPKYDKGAWIVAERCVWDASTKTRLRDVGHAVCALYVRQLPDDDEP